MKTVDIMFPVYWRNLDEIEPCLKQVLPLFTAILKAYRWKVVFAINGPNTDPLVSRITALAQNYGQVGYDCTAQTGKGSGIIHSWATSGADIVCYMDVDLATDIADFKSLIDGIEAGADLCIGSRYHRQSTVVRSFKRKMVSVIYHRYFMRWVLGARTFTDAQCGFKAVNRRVIRDILPLVRNRSWFFESELLYIAQKKQLRILEIPVSWKESPCSGVTLYRAILEFLSSSLLLRLRDLAGRLEGKTDSANG